MIRAGAGGADFGVSFPVFRFCEMNGVEGVDEEFLEARLSNEFDGAFAAFGLKGVVVIPEWVTEFGEGVG